MKKKILILLIFIFPEVVFSAMYQKTQGNLNNLPVNNSEALTPAPTTPPTPELPTGPVPDSGPLSNVYPQFAYFSSEAYSSRDGHALAQAKCETLGPGWRLPSIEETTPGQSVSMISDNFPAYSFYYHSTGTSSTNEDGTTTGNNWYFYMSVPIQKILCYHP